MGRLKSENARTENVSIHL